MLASLIDIFNRTGRIVVDIATSKNFITRPNGQVVCVDIGLALLLEKREGIALGNRRNSEISLAFWRDTESFYDGYFLKASLIKSYAVRICKALLFIKEHRPDIVNVDFLKNNPNIVKILATAYKSQELMHLAKEIVDQSNENKKIPDISLNKKDILSEAIETGKKTLLNEQDITIENLKESCIRELARYLQSRGSIKDKEFSASLRTFFFRTTLALVKAEYVKVMMNKINQAETTDVIKEIVRQAQQDKMLTKSYTTSGLSLSLSRCMLMTDFVEQNRQDKAMRIEQA